MRHDENVESGVEFVRGLESARVLRLQAARRPVRRLPRGEPMKPAWIGVALPTLRCACGSADLVAVAPGREPDGADRPRDLFSAPAANADRGEPMRCWCWDCWRSFPSWAL